MAEPKDPAASSGKKATTRKTTTTAAAKKTTASSTRASGAKKTTVKKTAAKKTAARTTAKTSAAKTVAKKSTTKRTAAPKSATAKTATRKPAARKRATAKTTARKPATSRTPAAAAAPVAPAPTEVTTPPPPLAVPEPPPRRRRRTAGVVAGAVAVASILGVGGYFVLKPEAERGSPQATVEAYYRALDQGDCRKAATYVDPEFATEETICEQFEDIREASGSLSEVTSVDERENDATIRIVRVVGGVDEGRLVDARRVDGDWLLSGGRSCFAVEHPEDLGNDHLAEGEGFGGYSSNPPTSGPHDPVATEAGVIYEQPQPVEQLVHSMEHGAVVFWVGDVDPELRDRLVASVNGVFDQGYQSLIVTPYDSVDGAFAMTAWGSLQRCVGVDGGEVVAFVESFYASGFEGQLACEGEAADLPPCIGDDSV